MTDRKSAGPRTAATKTSKLGMEAGNDDGPSSFDPRVLAELASSLSRDQPIDILEDFESRLKIVLRNALRGRVSGEVARVVAQFQKDVGLLCKYKSYAIKCASPLGYSIFLQSAGEGFSFQRHISHKTEIFHILDVMPGGFVFICDFDEWSDAYDRESFAAWLAGTPDERYERFRIQPRPGDVFTINELGVVHTVVGCVLEEYATVSTDMVDRLHDQNESKQIPSHFNREYVRSTLKKLSFPSNSRLIDRRPAATERVRDLEHTEIEGGTMIPLSRTAVHATRYFVSPAQSTSLFKDAERAASIYIAAGFGRVVIADDDEIRRPAPPSIQVSSGDLLMIPAGINYGFINEGSQLFQLSEQRISLDVAFL